MIRQHVFLPWQALTELGLLGHNETGAVFEQSVQLVFNDTLKVTLRQIMVKLNLPTRDGDDKVRLLYEGMMIAIPPVHWQSFAQLNVDATVQFLQQLAAQMELSKFCSHPRGEKRKSPNPSDKKTNLTSPLLDC